MLLVKSEAAHKFGTLEHTFFFFFINLEAYIILSLETKTVKRI